MVFQSSTNTVNECSWLQVDGFFDAIYIIGAQSIDGASQRSRALVLSLAMAENILPPLP